VLILRTSEAIATSLVKNFRQFTYVNGKLITRIRVLVKNEPVLTKAVN
jgi:hypothetical protein